MTRRAGRQHRAARPGPAPQSARRGGRKRERQEARSVVSLERALSKLGLVSRVEARSLVAAGRVRVGERIVTDPGWRIDPDRDELRIDGRRVRRAAAQHWLVHKPVGFVTTRRDPERRPTVYDLLPPGTPFIAPVGRLDLDSSGLLLLTNDTRLAAFLTDPSSHVEKVYEVQLDAPISSVEAMHLASGVQVLGRKTLPARVELAAASPCAGLRVTLIEGRNRQVRRMFATIGRGVVRLHRVRIGPLRIGALAAGAARPLRPAEIAALESLRRGD